MQIVLPDVNHILHSLINVESTFDGKKQKIDLWVEEHRTVINENIKLIENSCEENDIKILLMFLQAVLVRAMTGEKGQKVFNELSRIIRRKIDLQEENYINALKRAEYRWGAEKGSMVISDIIHYFGEKLDWKWRSYLSAADENWQTNFIHDELLKIKNIGFKLRDLALSNFNPHYAAFDLHVSRVATRIGLLNYGFELLNESGIEMGNNPSDAKNYLFLHRLFIKLSKMTGEKFLAVDFDRIFWHFGKAICQSRPKCSYCPIKPNCLTGKYK
jgi:hypothetical protein